MNTISLKYTPYSIYTIDPFGTAHGTRDHTQIMLISLSEDGFTGFGEASMPPYYSENQESMAAFYAKIDVEKLLNYSSITLALKYVDEIDKGNTAAKASIDIALHDLRAKQSKITVHELYKLPKINSIKTSMTIGIDSLEKVLSKVEQFSAFELLKIKLDGHNDVRVIEAIRNISDQKLLIDLNQGWSDMSKAKKTVRALEPLNIEMIEQPFKIGELKNTRELKEYTDIPIIADEDCQRESDIAALVKIYDGINIKLMKCTGLSEALRMIDTARSYDLKIMLGCMSESSIGISAAAQIASLVDWNDLDGNLLLSNDPCTGILTENDRLVYNNLPGIGLTDTRQLESLIEKDY